mmetsp:Transcript_42009/g.110663  ORF Transcript_42009/g.110663 Transcript_42009/m.110663 type:complete len:226 (+) Transcript_42009:27-704(+)
MRCRWRGVCRSGIGLYPRFLQVSLGRSRSPAAPVPLLLRCTVARATVDHRIPPSRAKRQAVLPTGRRLLPAPPPTGPYSTSTRRPILRLPCYRPRGASQWSGSCRKGPGGRIWWWGRTRRGGATGMLRFPSTRTPSPWSTGKWSRSLTGSQAPTSTSPPFWASPPTAPRFPPCSWSACARRCRRPGGCAWIGWRRSSTGRQGRGRQCSTLTTGCLWILLISLCSW